MHGKNRERDNFLGDDTGPVGRWERVPDPVLDRGEKPPEKTTV